MTLPKDALRHNREEMKRMLLQGITYEAISKHFKCSRQRVHQLIMGKGYKKIMSKGLMTLIKKIEYERGMVYKHSRLLQRAHQDLRNVMARNGLINP